MTREQGQNIIRLLKIIAVILLSVINGMALDRREELRKTIENIPPAGSV